MLDRRPGRWNAAAEEDAYAAERLAHAPCGDARCDHCDGARVKPLRYCAAPGAPVRECATAAEWQAATRRMLRRLPCPDPRN